jgi:hypothetical protein
MLRSTEKKSLTRGDGARQQWRRPNTGTTQARARGGVTRRVTAGVACRWDGVRTTRGVGGGPAQDAVTGVARDTVTGAARDAVTGVTQHGDGGGPNMAAAHASTMEVDRASAPRRGRSPRRWP